MDVLVLALTWAKLTFVEKARTHHSILTELYNKRDYKYKYLLMVHRISHRKRRPPLLVFTINGFEPWMLIRVLLDPDKE